LSQHEKLARANNIRFERIRTALLDDVKEATPPFRKLRETEALLTEIRDIKGKNKRIENSSKVLLDRKQSQEKVVVLAKERSALSKKEITKIASKSEKLKETQATEYNASMQAYIQNRKAYDFFEGARENTQSIEVYSPELKFGQDTSVSNCYRGLEQAFQVQLQQKVPFNAEIKPSTAGARDSSDPQSSSSKMQCFENENVLAFQYTAKDGGAFNVELSAIGKNLRVFVLPSVEKDRRVLQGERIKLQQELSEHGFIVKEFIVRGNSYVGSGEVLTKKVTL
ncbi:MAG: hypothetical protein GYA55_07415, partial [SAR324 cluster bacterium]|nr:hypothetical protein [SAR324 cluster bacterium]